MEVLEYIKPERILQRGTIAACDYLPPAGAALEPQHQDPGLNTALFLDFSVLTFNTENYSHFHLLF